MKMQVSSRMGALGVAYGNRLGARWLSCLRAVVFFKTVGAERTRFLQGGLDVEILYPLPALKLIAFGDDSDHQRQSNQVEHQHGQQKACHRTNRLRFLCCQ